MKFIVDAMLGRLAKWLRLLGFDTLYDTHVDDRQLIAMARAQQRILITRDSHLKNKKGIPDVIFITSDHLAGQLQEIKARLDMKQAHPLGRCVLCNGTFRTLSHQEIMNTVPEHVFHNMHDFEQCTDCGKVYWKGTHLRNASDRLAQLLGASHED